MLFAIMCEDCENSTDLRKQTRPAHIARLDTLAEQNRVILAGPHPDGQGGFTGSLIVAEFENIESAQAWAEADPYIDAGIYKKVTVKPFKRAY